MERLIARPEGESDNVELHMNPEIADQRLGLDNLLDGRDYLFRLLDSIDWDAQLGAIRSVLVSNRSAAEGVAADIAELGERAETYSGPHHHHVVDEHVDAMWRSTYSDAAVSLSESA
ncbi:MULTISPECIES: hypothetical protein [unclassified Mesorhizobium]|uniref:hypothetical protein n=1 Tax=unclassified Mesorhizobium TaxID=325217 RepID=UPI00112AB1CD|nr:MULTISPECIES: hypothetical protein [unclassified Mesorhizobium]MBZ9810944.1 hypothetical protein [Mesorhizobium sp. ESP-6-2]TPM27733.1 hypothetical protein FJ955_17665 [Mesorhizobium sp. B2-2-2]